MTCQELETKTNARGKYFIANERFLDYDNGSFFCSTFRYVISIRETVSRVKSHFNHMRLKALSRNPLCRNNYLTWALATGKMEPNSSYPENPNNKSLSRYVAPDPSWLPVAEEVLQGYDYILDSQDSVCRDTILNLLGFNETRGEEQNVGNKTVYLEFNESEITKHNQMDMSLYNLSRELIRADCDFAKELVRYEQINDVDNANI